MLITDDFVMLNFPKTGSSFARKAIFKVYEARDGAVRKWFRQKLGGSEPAFELMLPKLESETSEPIKDQHGTLRQIPVKYRERAVVSVVRNPLDRYVSTYLFQWWRRFPPAPEAELKSVYLDWPELSFRDFYSMIHQISLENRLKRVRPKIELGMQTVQFIQFYFPDAENLLSRIDESWIESDAWREEMPKIEFLHQENLSEELKVFLRLVGMRESLLGMIEDTGKVNVTERNESSRNFWSFYDEALLSEVLWKDRLLFRIFPEYLPYFPG